MIWKLLQYILICMQPQISEQQQSTQFKYFGIVRVAVSRQYWQLWKQKAINDQLSTFQSQTMHESVRRYLSPKIACEVRRQQQSTWVSEYILMLYQIHGQETNTFKNITMDGGIQYEVEQLQDLSIIKLYDPFIIPWTSQLPPNLMPWHYYQNQKKYYIGIEVWVSEKFLLKCSQKYELQKDQKIKMLSQKGFIQSKQQSDLQRQIKQFSSILKNIKKKKQVLQKNEVPSLQHQKKQEKQEQNQNKDKDKEEAQLQGQDYEPLENKEFKDLFNSEVEEPKKIISYNLNNQVGLFFDLNELQIDEYNPPNIFRGQLKPYQKKALYWMLFRQGKIQNKTLQQLSADVPFWEDIDARLALGFPVFFNESMKAIIYNQKGPEKQCQGGILADEMGLGKTIMMISLIVSNRPSQEDPKQTLVIAPLSVLQQWKSKLQEFAPSLKVLIFHGNNLKTKNIASFDVIITSEAKIRSQMIKANQVEGLDSQGLTDLGWFRVIIDEAHNFRNPSTKMAAAIYSLNSKYRWCLSGTPAQNSIRDMHSLLRFLQLSPWESKNFWQKQFPKKDRDVQKKHFILIKQILKGIMLRRKKNSSDQNGNNLLQLPKLDIKLHYVQMSKAARIFYRELNLKADQRLSNLQKMDKDKQEMTKLQKKLLSKRRRRLYTSILGLIIRMRMICCHAFLHGYSQQFTNFRSFQENYFDFIGKKKIKRYPKVNFFQYEVGNKKFKDWALKKTSHLKSVYDYWQKKFEAITRGYNQPCFMCKNQQFTLTFTPCLHFFCKQCIISALTDQKEQQQRQKDAFISNTKEKLKTQKLANFQGSCPQCGEQLRLLQIFPVPRDNQFGIDLSHFQPNQKILKLIQYLKKMQGNQKAIVYTSFIGMMRLLQLSFQRKGIKYKSLKGSDSLETRTMAIQQFSSSWEIKVLVITLKIGSVGLNLQAANKIFIMDPWWNPAIQQQAIARAHRFGQSRQIQVIKFVTQQSIQAKIVKRSHSKKNMIDSILDIDDLYNEKNYSISNRQQIQYLLQADEDQRENKKQQNYQKQKKPDNNFFRDFQDQEGVNDQYLVDKFLSNNQAKNYQQYLNSHPLDILKYEQKQSKIENLKNKSIDYIKKFEDKDIQNKFDQHQIDQQQLIRVTINNQQQIGQEMMIHENQFIEKQRYIEKQSKNLSDSSEQFSIQ